MELKYTSKDYEKILNAFNHIANEVGDISQLKAEDLKDLLDYPTDVLEMFLKTIVLFDEKQIKTQYQGVKGYILLRMNFCCK